MTEQPDKEDMEFLLRVRKETAQRIHTLIRKHVVCWDAVVGTEGSMMWDCPESPFGYCCYRHSEDPAHDNCVFCGQPEERK